MWIKVCGNTNLDDAHHAVAAGANALGFIFAPSPRQITPEAAREITSRLPIRIEKYGVFVNTNFDEILSIVERAGLTGVQLHVNADPRLPLRLREHFSTHLRRSRFSILSVVHFPGDLERQLDLFARDHAIDAVLVDSRGATAPGGTGIPFDWQAAQRSFFRAAPHLRLIAAGGLNPENVAEAIHTLSPWGVDAVTGLEIAPGKKDPARVEAFVRTARETAARHTAALKEGPAST